MVAAAVIVTVVVVVLTVGTGTGAGVAAVGAAAAAADSPGHSKSIDRDNQNEEEIEEYDFVQESPPAVNLSTAHDERISSFKEEELFEKKLLVISKNMPREESASFIEKTRELGSVLAHTTLEGISDVASIIPQILQEAKSLLPDTYFPSNKYSQSSPIKTFEEAIVYGHQKIDQLFATDQAVAYTFGIHGSDKFTHGIIPLPGPIGTFGRIPASQATNTWGWKLGDSIRNRTVFGNVPKWCTVRQRHWKNDVEMVKLHPERYIGDPKSTPENIKRMEKGLAPQRINERTGKIESMELHHDPAQRDGGLFNFIEVWPEEHAELDACRKMGK